MPNDILSIRIAANFTVEPVEEFLAYWMSKLQIPADIRIAPYNQVFQQLLEGGLLRSNQQGLNLIALDLDAWLADGTIAAGRVRLERTVGDLMGVLRAVGGRGAVLMFPPAPTDQPDRASALAAAKASIQNECSSIPGWSALDLAETAKLYSISELRDPFTDELGNIPFTEEMYAAAASAAARWIRSVCSKPRKVIVLDCDNTMWQGVCGEGSVQVTAPYRGLQEFMLRQRDSGMLLAIVSKNNEPDVMTAMESEACLLRPEHFASWRINWLPKSENLSDLADELGLALDTFVFLDDSSYECMEVRNRCADVLTIQLPLDPDLIPGFLEHLLVFDRPSATEEDRNRASMYQAERQRAEWSRRALTNEEFLESLQIEVQFAPLNEAEIARVAQLTQRTTQFNMTNVLHNEQTLPSLLAQGKHECWTVRVRDVFGEYGLVGALLFEKNGDNLRVDTWLLSCRALGRGVEDRMLDNLKRWATERGAERVIVPVMPTGRNRPAREFLNRHCGAPVDSLERFECVLAAAGGSSEWRAPEVVATQNQLESRPIAAKLPLLTDEEDTLVSIATGLQTGAAIIAALRTGKKRRPAEAGPWIAPCTVYEGKLARIWSECLGVEPIGAKDNFFAFGGSSLIAARILTRVRAEFGVKLSLTSLFQTPTVERMAALITEALTCPQENLAAFAPSN